MKSTAVDYMTPLSVPVQTRSELQVVVFVVDLTFSEHQLHLVTQSIKQVHHGSWKICLLNWSGSWTYGWECSCWIGVCRQLRLYLQLERERGIAGFAMCPWTHHQYAGISSTTTWWIWIVSLSIKDMFDKLYLCIKSCDNQQTSTPGTHATTLPWNCNSRSTHGHQRNTKTRYIPFFNKEFWTLVWQIKRMHVVSVWWSWRAVHQITAQAPFRPSFPTTIPSSTKPRKTVRSILHVWQMWHLEWMSRLICTASAFHRSDCR